MEEHIQVAELDGDEFKFTTEFEDVTVVGVRKTADSNKVAVAYTSQYPVDRDVFEYDPWMAKIHHYGRHYLSRAKYEEIYKRVVGAQGKYLTTKGALCDRYEHSGTWIRLVEDRHRVRFQYAMDTSYFAALIEFSDDQRNFIKHTAPKERMAKALELARLTVDIYNGDAKWYAAGVTFGRVVDGYLRTEDGETCDGFYHQSEAIKEARDLMNAVANIYNNKTIPIQVFANV